MPIFSRFPVLRVLSCLPLSVMLAVGSVRAQHTPKGTPVQLYVVAATPHSDDPYPVTLYRISKDKHLDMVRLVVPQKDGSDYVRASGRVIVFPYPDLSSKSIAIVHMDDPMRTDNVSFDPSGAGSLVDLAEPPNSGFEVLIAWLEIPNSRQVAISTQMTRASQRLDADRWSDYAHWRSDGVYGGPILSPTIIGATVQDGNLVMNRFGHSVTISPLPPSIRNISPKFVPFIYVATDKYLIFELTEGRGFMHAPEASELFAYDRPRGAWKTIQTEGSYPRVRLFGNWIAEIITDWNETPDTSARPGSGNERTWEERTDDLPPVQALYRTLGVEGAHLPGVLVLQNLVDGRKIRIETDQEDSEILWADDASVLYRVNDTIYRAMILGDRLGDATMLVKDDDVPEIHWVFWSK